MKTLLILIISSLLTTCLSLANASSINDHSGKTINLTVINNKKQAEYIIEELRKKIPYNFPDGCFAKAHEMAITLEQEGIISGKYFIEGQIFYKSSWGESFWLYHVAPVILINEDGIKVPYIIDFFLSDKILPLDEWKLIVSKDKRTKITDSYFMNRFTYDPTEKEQELNEYKPEDIYDMNLVFKQIQKRLDGIQQGK